MAEIIRRTEHQRHENEAPKGLGVGKGVSLPMGMGLGPPRIILGILYMKCCNLVHIHRFFYKQCYIEFALLLYHCARIHCAGIFVQTVL